MVSKAFLAHLELLWLHCVKTNNPDSIGDRGCQGLPAYSGSLLPVTCYKQLCHKCVWKANIIALSAIAWLYRFKDWHFYLFTAVTVKWNSIKGFIIACLRLCFLWIIYIKYKDTHRLWILNFIRRVLFYCQMPWSIQWDPSWWDYMRDEGT